MSQWVGSADLYRRRLPDGTVIWTSPSGHTYVTTPGSALLFPQLCAPTGDLAPPQPRPADACADRAAMMPKRGRTRAENRARYVAAERRFNHRERQARKIGREEAWVTAPSPGDLNAEPPPF